MRDSSNFSAYRREPNSHECGRAAKCKAPETAGQGTTSATHWSANAPTFGRVSAPKNYLVKSLAVRIEITRCCVISKRAAAPGTASRNQQVLRRAYTANSLARWHKSVPLHRQQYGASGIWRRALRGLLVLHASYRGPALPNPSLEARPNSKTPGPRSGLAHFPPRGPGVLLSVPPQLER